MVGSTKSRLLSPRTIHFTPNELIWECLEEVRCESSRPNITVRNQRPEFDHHCLIVADPVWLPDVLRRWHSIVHEYSGLDLSFQGDKLPAISGVAKQMQGAFEHLLGVYVAGLWGKTIQRSFMWYRKYSNAACARPHSSVAPTWSWASASGAARLPDFKYAALADDQFCKKMSSSGLTSLLQAPMSTES